MSDAGFQIATWAVTGVALVGMHLNARMNRWGFACWWVTNTSWIAVGVYKGVYAQSFQHVVYLYFSIVGFATWTRRQRRLAEATRGPAEQRIPTAPDSGDAH